ncbi:hypothetical protein [Streptomyces platensis]|uniref:hypothetical protein n=1 Tax=Streptomyces platensis TaxID=58346 RepID=UPI00386DD36B|nr:hypothetical protein OG962_17865 [Streptomyces platensis]
MTELLSSVPEGNWIRERVAGVWEPKGRELLAGPDALTAAVSDLSLLGRGNVRSAAGSAASVMSRAAAAGLVS